MGLIDTMGWHYILHLRCKVLSEYREFIEQEYLRKIYNIEDNYEYMHYIDKDDIEIYSDDDDDEKKEKTQQILARKEIIQEAITEIEDNNRYYNTSSKTIRDFIDIWRNLKLGWSFYKYTLSDDGVFECELSRKVTDHPGGSYSLAKDLLSFIKDIIVMITSEITECYIESDDFGDAVWHYTDRELRNIPFNYKDKIKSIQHVYSEDGSEIYETRVVYKHTIKNIEFIDLDRCYK